MPAFIIEFGGFVLSGSIQKTKNLYMIVLKFGGTSVGKPERMKKIAELVMSTPGKKIVVLSALSGTTNALVSIGDHLLLGQKAKAEEVNAAVTARA